VSTAPFEEDRSSASESVAGFLAAISLTASVIALIAAALAKERHARLAAIAVAGASAAWLVGMAVAVLTSNPIY
jgi:hypothetical protein